MLRFLATGDIQAHNWKQFSYLRKDGLNSRLFNCVRVLDLLREEAEERKVDKVLLNGDLFEESDFISVEVYNAVYERLEKIHSQGIETVLNLGNHDVALQSGGRVLHSLRPFRKIAQVVEESKLVWERLQIVPWMANPEDIKKAIAGMDAGEEIGLVLHYGIQGARAGPKNVLLRNPLSLQDVRSDEFGVVLLSDYHTHQWIADNVLYLGSPLQHSFGESHKPCVWDVTLLDKSPWVRLKKIYTPFPRFRRVRARYFAELRAKLFTLHGDYVRCTIEGGEITDQGVERLVKETDCQVQIYREGEDNGDDILPAQISDSELLMSKYVEANVHSLRRRKRLVKLGLKLYN